MTADDESHEATRLLIAPFDRSTADQAQNAWARACGVPMSVTNSVGMRFVLIPPGEYMRGGTVDQMEPEWRAGAAQLDDYKQHRTVLTKPMYVAVHHVTQREFTVLTGSNPSDYSPTGDLASDVEGQDTNQFPVDQVTWFDCVDACNALSVQEGLAPYYKFGSEILRWPFGGISVAEVEVLGGNGYRLLTSAEWEFVGRAGTTTIYYFGDDAEKSPWYDAEGAAGPVESVGPNNFGIFDLHTYYEEWCFDAHAFSYRQFVGGTAVDPVDLYEKDLERVTRGLKACSRGGEPSGNPQEDRTFRMCRTIG